MKILVTGGIGYIGSHTVVELLNNNYEVIVIDNLSNSKEEVVDKIKEITNKDFKFYKGDLGDYELLDKIHSTNIFKFPRDRDSLISYIKKFIDEKKEYQKQRSRRIDAFSEAASTLNDKSIPSFKKFSSFKELMEVFVEEIS